MSQYLRKSVYQNTQFDKQQQVLGQVANHEQGTKVQYIYQMNGVPRFSFSQNLGHNHTIPASPPTDQTDLVAFIPNVPRDAFGGVVGKLWWYNNQTNAYVLQEYRAGLFIFIPENITINSIKLYLYAGPVFSSILNSPVTNEYLHVDQMKLYLDSVSSAIPYTYLPLAVGGALDSCVQQTINTPTDITASVLAGGGSSWSPTDGSAIRSTTADLTSKFSPGDFKYLEFREGSGTTTNASGSTLFAYAVLEGYVDNRSTLS